MRMNTKDSFALLFMECGKSDKHARSCISHGCNSPPFGFSSLGSFGLAAEDLLDRFYRKYVIHAQSTAWEAHT